MALPQKAEEYFSTINSMAHRMCVDLKEAKTSYENLWQTLTYEEQQQLLSQSIIKPEISIKYPMKEKKNIKKSSEYAVKMIIDDTYTYRDEHSGPFCFRTTSQRDLTVFQKRTSPKKSAVKVMPPKAVIPVIIPERVMVPQESLEIDPDEADSTSLTHILPKTGLDLLDNW